MREINKYNSLIQISQWSAAIYFAPVSYFFVILPLLTNSIFTGAAAISHDKFMEECTIIIKHVIELLSKNSQYGQYISIFLPMVENWLKESLSDTSSKENIKKFFNLINEFDKIPILNISLSPIKDNRYIVENIDNPLYLLMGSLITPIFMTGKRFASIYVTEFNYDRQIVSLFSLIQNNLAFRSINNQHKNIEALDLLLSRLTTAIVIASIPAGVITHLLDVIVKPMQKNILFTSIAQNFIDGFLDSYITYVPINLTSYKGSLESLRNIGRIVALYNDEIQKDKYLMHTLVSGNKESLEYIRYILCRLFPNMIIQSIDFHNSNSYFEKVMTSSHKQSMFRELDSSGYEDYEIIGLGTKLLKLFHYNFNLIVGKLSNQKKFFLYNLRNNNRSLMKNSADILESFSGTNGLLSTINTISKNSVIIGYSEHSSVDSAIANRFGSLIQLDQSYASFVHFCKQQYMENILRTGTVIFPSEILDRVIYQIASKIYNKKDNISATVNILKKIFYMAEKYQDITIETILKYI